MRNIRGKRYYQSREIQKLNNNQITIPPIPRQFGHSFQAYVRREWRLVELKLKNKNLDLNYFFFKCLTNSSELYLIYSLPPKMIMKVFGPMFQFSNAAKYSIYKGKYLIPEPPKRPLSAYILFSSDARAKLQHAQGQKVNIGQDSKLIAQKWKQLSLEQKAKYQNKNQEQRKKYEEQKRVYDAQYVDPFKSTNYMSLMMKQFYAKNKSPNFLEGTQAFQNFKKNLTEEQLVNYKKMAEEAKKQNEKIKKLYEIPTLQYPTLNSYLLAERKRTPSIPKKSQMDKKSLEKYEKKYSEYKNQFADNFKAFANSFHIKTEDILKMINKEKPKEEKINEKGQQIKELQKIQEQKLAEEVKQLKAKIVETKRKAKAKANKIVDKEVKKVTKQLEQTIRRKARVSTRFTGKINEFKRLKAQEQIKTSVQKDKKKEKKAKVEETPQDGNPTEPAKKTRGRPKSKTEGEKTQTKVEAKSEETSLNK